MKQLRGHNTSAGPPASGYHEVGNSVVDADGVEWICTVAGDPGTFVNQGTASDASELAARVAKAGDTMTGALHVPDEVYDATSWNGSTEVPTKNAFRDKIESLSGASVPVLALGSDAAANSVLLQAALNSHTSWQLAAGTFNYDTTLTYGSNSELVGVAQTVLNYTGAGTGIVSATPGTRTYSLKLVDIKLTTSTGAIGIDLDSHSSGDLTNVTVTGFSSKCWRLGSASSGFCVYNNFRDCYAGSTAGTGWSIDATATNSNQWFGCRANVCGIGVSITDSNGNVWLGGSIEACTTGWYVTASAPQDGNVVAYCRFEGNTTAVNINTSSVRSAGVIAPVIIGTFVVIDKGTRTVFFGLNSLPNAAGSAPNLIGLSGSYWSYPATHGTAAYADGTMVAHPVYVPRTISIARIGAEVTAAGVGGTVVRLGVWLDNGVGEPGSLVLDAGTIDGTSATAQEITLGTALQLTGGYRYWFSAVAQGGAPTIRVVPTNVAGWSGEVGTLAAATGTTGTARPGRSIGSISGALPGQFGTGALGTGIPLIAVKFA